MKSVFFGLMTILSLALAGTAFAADPPNLKDIQGSWSGAGRYWILEMKVNGTAVIGTMECNGSGVINFFRGSIQDDGRLTAYEDANPVRTISGTLPEIAVSIGGGVCRAESFKMRHRA